jgi:hypothetical protein
VPQSEKENMLKAIWVYGHLLCFALAFGLIVRGDWRLLRQRHRELSVDTIRQLGELARLVSLCLAGLWVSGIALVVIGYGDEGTHYLMNQKLWAKGVVVLAMTLNGWALHTLGLPRLHAGVCIARLPARQKVGLLLLGGVSAASWMYASFLGVARVLNHKAALESVLAGYVAVITLCVMVGWCAHRPRQELVPAR